MKELIKINYKDNTALARDVYDFVYKGVEKKQAFTHWFNRTVNKYGFEETKDFMPIWTESTGGRPSIDYVVSFDMGKELCMVSPTKNGSKARKYFLRCEQIAKEAYAQSQAIRAIGIETRKSLTDSIKESGENERMHGKGYSNYTRMVYEITGFKDRYKEYKEWKKTAEGKESVGFREGWLNADELKRVEQAEALIKPMLELERQYDDIKKALKPLFERKEIK